MREPYEFVVAEGGVLRAYDRLLEVQQSLHREDVPVAERNLFQLRGNVKEVGYVRAYRDDFLKTMDKDTNGSHPFAICSSHCLSRRTAIWLFMRITTGT